MTKKTICVLSLLLLSFTVTAHAESYARWGALAVCRDCGARGGGFAWTYGHRTAEDAEQAVRDHVLKNHGRVKILVTTSDRYIAVAFAKTGSVGYENDDRERTAFEAAVGDCKSSFGNVEKVLVIDNVRSTTQWAFTK